MKITAVVEALVASGATPDTILAAVRAIESQQVDVLEKRREADRNRQAKLRSVTLGHVTSERSRSHVRVEDSSSRTEVTEEGKKELAPAAPTPRGELENVLDVERADAVIAHRRSLRKPLTVRAAKLLASQFRKCPEPNAAADRMIARGWIGFEPEWMDQGRGQGPPRNGNGGLTRNQREQRAFDEVFDERERSDQAGFASPFPGLPKPGAH